MLTGYLAMIALGQSYGATPLPSKPFSLMGTDIAGQTHSIPVKGAAASVVFFIMKDCPIANRLAPEIGRICDDYGKRNVASFIVYVDPDAQVKDIDRHYKLYGYRCPAFLDKSLAWAKKLRPKVSPEAIVLDKTGKMVYRGRINDLFGGHGEVREKAKTNDLRDALDAVLAGKKIARPDVPAVGCYLNIN